MQSCGLTTSDGPVFNEQTSLVLRVRISSSLSCFLLISHKDTVLWKADLQSKGREELKPSEVFQDMLSLAVAESVSMYLALGNYLMTN